MSKVIEFSHWLGFMALKSISIAIALFLLVIFITGTLADPYGCAAGGVLLAVLFEVAPSEH